MNVPDAAGGQHGQADIPPGRKPRRRTRLSVGVLVTSGTAATLAGWLWYSRARHAPGDRTRSPLPTIPVAAIRSSPYRNTTAEATYIGGAACAECHPQESESYRSTPHALTLDDADPARQPADGSLTDDILHRDYAVYRRDGWLWHRMSIPAGEEQELTLEEHPARFVIGSGSVGRSYLMETDGFLVQSPITWYASLNGWDLSPGFGRSAPVGFTREVDLRCLQCHTGRLPGGADSSARHEPQSISCESCHGPGSLHAARHQAADAEASGPPHGDRTIVNPRRMPRGLSEAICAQCHLESAASVDLRQRSLTEFRPGLHLEDFSAYYQVVPQDHVRLVGHVEQLHMSRCYESSAELTCVTCHHPHEPLPSDPNEMVRWRTEQCRNCHASAGSVQCSLNPAERRRESPVDDCTHCHMPFAQTDVPHVASTDHRIAVHSSHAPRPVGQPVALAPVYDLGHLPAIDQQRCLGLACLVFAESDDGAAVRDRQIAQAHALLNEVHAEGLADPTVDAALSQIQRMLGNPHLARRYADAAIRSGVSTTASRIPALANLAWAERELGRPERAIPALEELTRLRRDASDWRSLAACRLDLGEREPALAAMQRCVAIDPNDAEVQWAIVNLAGELGKSELVARHRVVARALDRVNPPSK
jgi:hypothetical protein